MYEGEDLSTCGGRPERSSLKAVPGEEFGHIPLKIRGAEEGTTTPKSRSESSSKKGGKERENCPKAPRGI